MSDLARFVNNTNGLSITGVEDSEYIELDGQYADLVIDEVMESNDLPDLPDGAILRTLRVADLVAVYDAAKALMHSDQRWDRREPQREALANAVAIVHRGEQ